MNTDVKVNFLAGERNVVRILSTSKSRLTGGIFKLAQKVTHGLLTNIGDDISAPQWGGDLLRIFEVPVLPTQQPQVFSKCRSSVKKVENDILVQQESIVSENDSEEDARLKSLELLRVYPDTDNMVWLVDINITAQSEKELAIGIS